MGADVRRGETAAAQADGVRRQERREWLCEYLVLGEGAFGKTDKPSDATHRGFTWSALGEIHQRVYRFQPGDDRSTERETIHSQLAASKKVPSHAEHLAKKRLERPINPAMDERIQEGYGRRGMGRR